MIILLSGKAGVGKDTFAEMLKKELENRQKRVIILHFADRLKQICKDCLGWNGEKDEEGRTLLQQFGTEDVRSRLPHFWVDDVYRTIQAIENYFDVYIVADFRLPNEHRRLYHDYGYNVVTVRLYRDFESKLTLAQQFHESEIALDGFDFDYYINGGTCLEDLEKITRNFAQLI